MSKRLPLPWKLEMHNVDIHKVLQSRRANFVVFKIFCYFQESVQEGSTLSLWEDTVSTCTALLQLTCCHVIKYATMASLWGSISSCKLMMCCT